MEGCRVRFVNNETYGVSCQLAFHYIPTDSFTLMETIEALKEQKNFRAKKTLEQKNSETFDLDFF
jgi:hypothetical protein